jgi:hypothetical protein
VKGKLTLFSEQGMTRAQAYALFLGSIRGLGFATVSAT